jgi:hypothetical protein
MPIEVSIFFTLQFILCCFPLYFYPRLSPSPDARIPDAATYSCWKELVIVKWVTPGTQILRHVIGALFVSLTLCKQPGGTIAGNTAVIPPYFFPICNSNLSSYRGPRLLLSCVLKRPDILSQMISLFCFPAFLSIFLPPSQFPSWINFLFPFCHPFLPFLFLCFLFNYNFISVSCIMYT